MRDTHAAARPTDLPADGPADVTADGPAAPPTAQPDTVLPYDPDDWNRRLAEARKRRDAVLRARAAAPPDATPGHGTGGPDAVHGAPVGGFRPALAHAAAPGDAARGGGLARRDTADWRRRLAEARGLTATGTVTPAPTATPRATDAITDGSNDGPTHKPVDLTPNQTADDTTEQARSGPASGATVTPTAAARGTAAAARPGTVVRVAAMAGLAGLAGGVALAAALIGAMPPEVRPVPLDGASTLASASEAVPPVALRAGFTPPAAPAPVAAVQARSVDTRPAQARPGLPAMPDTVPAAVTMPPPAMPRGWLPVAPPETRTDPLPDTPADRVIPAPTIRVAGAVPAPPRDPRSTLLPDVPDLRRDAPTGSGRTAAVAALPDSATATGGDTAPYVVTHVPPVAARNDLVSESAARGWAVVPVDFTVSRSHLRVYQAADLPAATALGDRLGLPIRDFIGAIPAPRGLIEVWVAGGPEAGG